MMAALVHKDRADYRQSAAFAADAARKAKQAGANLLYARAISLESGLDWYLGDDHWRQLSEQALGICKQFGDQACVAAVLRRFGNSGVDNAQPMTRNQTPADHRTNHRAEISAPPARNQTPRTSPVSMRM